MRSELIFNARDRVQNPFLLCQLVRISSRRVHRAGEGMPATINKILRIVHAADANYSPEEELAKAV
jgi:hypothetical protein